MSDEKAKKLLQGGIKAAQQGDKDLARRAFLQVIKLEPENEAAWLGLATVGRDTKEKLQALKHLLQINPQSEKARTALERLGIPPERLLGTSSEAQVDDMAETTGDEPPVDVDDVAQESPFVEDEIEAAAAEAIPDDDEIDEIDEIDELDEAAPAQPPSAFTADFEEGDEDEAYDWDIGEPPMPGDEAQPPAATGIDTSQEDIEDDLPSLDEILGTRRPASRQEPEPEPEEEPAEPAAATETLEDIEAAIDEEIDVPPRRTSAEAFEAAPPPPRGQAGTPIPPDDVLQAVTASAEERMQTYLDQALQGYRNVTWEQKRRGITGGLAGSREYSIFIGQVILGIIGLLLIFGAGFTALLLSSPSVRRIVLAPTATITPTPTFTPTATIGASPTPSPTPNFTENPTFTPSPTLNASVTPGNPDPNFPPEPTDFYAPQVVQADFSAQAEAGAEAILNGNYQEAFEFLQDDIRGSGEGNQNFWAYYYLSQLNLAQDDIEGAREIIAEGEERLPDTAVENYQPLVSVAKARVDIYEARQRIEEQNASPSSGEVQALLTSAEAELTDVIGNVTEASIGEATTGSDRRFVPAYVLLSERYQLENNYEDARQVVRYAINSGVSGEIYTDSRLRFQLAELYYEQDQYAAALQELDELLRINPFLEPALELQVLTALESNQPGLAVLFAEEYLLYQQDSARAFELLVQARRAEDKPDEALIAIARGLNEANPDDPAYPDLLQQRADIYEQQGRFRLAADTYEQLAALEGSTPELQVRQMEVAYRVGDYDTALNLANDLIDNENDDIPDSLPLLILGQILVDRGEEYADALEVLQQAVNAGLPEDERPAASEYIANAHLNLDNYDAGLEAINTALNAEETGSRYYIRARLLDERGRATDTIEDLQQAQDDYEFVLTWGTIYPYPFTEDAAERFVALDAELARRTAQAQAATDNSGS